MRQLQKFNNKIFYTLDSVDINDNRSHSAKIWNRTTDKRKGRNAEMRFAPYLLYKYVYFSSSTNFHNRAAIAPPISGATMKIQRLLRAVPPANNAGPMLRAGLTLVPV